MVSVRDGLVLVELRGEGRRILIIGFVFVNPEGVRVEETEWLFEVIQVDVMNLKRKVLM